MLWETLLGTVLLALPPAVPRALKGLGRILYRGSQLFAVTAQGELSPS